MTTTALGDASAVRQSIVVGEHHWQGYRYESRFVRSPRPRIAPVLLVGGAFQRKEDWSRIETGLLEHADVLTVDLPGWGAADVLPHSYGVDFLADALALILDEVGLARVNVIGGSYGTGIIYRLAQTRPEKVLRTVLVGTMVAIPAHTRELFAHTLRLLDAGRREEFAKATVDISLCHDPDVDIASRQILRRILLRRVHTATAREIEMYVANTRRLLEHRLFDTAEPPPQPVLVVTGEHDTFTTPAMCRELAATCPDSWFVTVERADHLLHLERSAEFVELSVRFLGGEPIDALPYCGPLERTGWAPGR